jgi:hypothetical protein
MAPWLAEKSEGVCQSLILLAHEIRKIELAPEARESLLGDIRGALYDATKIVEYAYDTETSAWSPAEVDRIVESGPDALQGFMSKVKEFSDHEIFKPFPRTE